MANLKNEIRSNESPATRAFFKSRYMKLKEKIALITVFNGDIELAKERLFITE